MPDEPSNAQSEGPDERKSQDMESFDLDRVGRALNRAMMSRTQNLIGCGLIVITGLALLLWLLMHLILR